MSRKLKRIPSDLVSCIQIESGMPTALVNLLLNKKIGA